MRTYAKVSLRMWTGQLGQALRGHFPRVTLDDSRRIWTRRAGLEALIERGTEAGR